MKRWTIAVLMLFVCSLALPTFAAPNEIATNPSTPTPISAVLDWFSSLWHSIVEAVTQLDGDLPPDTTLPDPNNDKLPTTNVFPGVEPDG